MLFINFNASKSDKVAAAVTEKADESAFNRVNAAEIRADAPIKPMHGKPIIDIGKFARLNLI